jgi:hypothetical protein
MLPLVASLETHHPEILERSEELAADKAYDSYENNERLYDAYAIKPLIDIRDSWKDGEETRPLIPGRADVFVHDEKGTISCICPATGEERPLFFHGFEKDRKTLKYRCPAAAYGFECLGRRRCESQARVGAFGRVVHVPLKRNRRTFTPIARSTQKWKKAYKRRTAVERVNARLDTVLGFEKHTIRGKKKMATRVTLALMVMLAMALGRLRIGQKALIRSLTPPPLRETG